MADETNTNVAVASTGPLWMNDVQKTLAYFITFSFVVLIFVWAFKPPQMAPESMAQLNQLVSTLQNIMLLAIGFFFGTNTSSKAKDESQTRIVEKLTATQPPGPPGPIAPLPTPPVVAWWSLLTDAERTAVGADAADPKVATFIAAAQIGKGSPDDLTYLVSKNLLTQARADTIKTT